MRRIGLMAFLLAILLPGALAAAEDTVPTRIGAGVVLGYSYDPDPQGFVQGHLCALFDYDAVWPHRAPAPLRFKLEASAGVADRDEPRALVSANMLALYYLDGLAAPRFRPYVEAGIGVAYADFQVEGQGARFAFNPQAGVGAEWGEGRSWFTAVRAHHLSNGGLHEDNRGSNAVLLLVGRYF